MTEPQKGQNLEMDRTLNDRTSKMIEPRKWPNLENDRTSNVTEPSKTVTKPQKFINKSKLIILMSVGKSIVKNIKILLQTFLSK
jgi:hypothetical protein